jgi:hypothetical protein
MTAPIAVRVQFDGWEICFRVTLQRQFAPEARSSPGDE